MRRALFPCFAVLLTTIAVACVGDDPTPLGSTADASSSSSSSGSSGGSSGNLTADGSTNDAAASSSGSSSGSLPPVPLPNPFADGECVHDAAFSDPVKLRGVSTADSESSFSFSHDFLTMYFTRRVDDVTGIYVSKRDNLDADFPLGSRLAGLQGVGQRDPFLFQGEKLLYTEELALRTRIRQATLNTNGTIASDQLLEPSSLTASDRNATLDGAQGLVCFASDRTPPNESGGGGNDLYCATYAVPLSAAAFLVGINTTADEDHPVISSDGLTLYFARGEGERRSIFVASRTSTSQVFSSVAEVPNVNHTTGSVPTSRPALISNNGCTLYFMSNRDGDTTMDLFYARRPVTFEP